MTGFVSKRQAAQAKLDNDTQVYADRKRGSIALARSLCYQINGAADDSDDINGGGYGSVDVAEILSAEVVRLQAALAQPAQEPVEDVVLYHDDGTRIVRIAPKRPWVDLTDNQIEQIYYDLVKIHRGAPMPWGQINFGKVLQAAIKEKNNAT